MIQGLHSKQGDVCGQVAWCWPATCTTFPGERALDRVPSFDFDAALTRATRVKVEQFLKDSGAQTWIQHDPPTYAGLKKAPEFYA